MNRNSYVVALGRLGAFALVAVIFISLFAAGIKASGSVAKAPSSFEVSGNGGSVRLKLLGKRLEWSYTMANVSSVSISSDGSYIAAGSRTARFTYSPRPLALHSGATC